HEQVFYTFVEQVPALIELEITGGLITHYRNRGNVRVALWKIADAGPDDQGPTLVATDRSVPPDGVQRTVELSPKEPGLYKIVIQDGGDRTQVTWPVGQRVTIRSSRQEPMNPNYSNWMLYFYVPKGTKVIGLHGGGHGEVQDSTGQPLFSLNDRQANFYSLPVPKGQDGKPWRIRYGRGAIRLLTVPPYFARSVDELLLPSEVVASDGE
ncbi:MAG TPA: hypothetical protein VE890_08565, partial [Thermoguttaceae bacterium]|nr:hypothetical protein [Thermoguttaceae bacterium]